MQAERESRTGRLIALASIILRHDNLDPIMKTASPYARVLSGVAAFAIGLVAVFSPVSGEEQLPWQTKKAPDHAYATRGADDTYRPGVTYGNEQRRYAGSGNRYDGNRDVYVPPADEAAPSGDVYRPGDAYRADPGASPPSSDYGYGEPYQAPPPRRQQAAPPPRDTYREPYDRDYGGRRPAQPPAAAQRDYYEQGEIIHAGHRFFGSISQGLAKAVEYVFSRQGRPNGYILGEDAGGAFVVGLRYGEGQLHTKDVGTHRVYWQGPSLGYDAGAEGSKTMVLVYNLHDVSDIYQRFGGVQGSLYVIGGVSVQFQKRDNVTLAVIRSGVGLRVGANVGYLKYTRAPTWNPL